MKIVKKPTLVLDNLIFPEGSRWNSGALYFSDIFSHEVVSVSLERKRETVFSLKDDYPIGLGWLPDGKMLIVSMLGKKLLLGDPETKAVSTYCDFSNVLADYSPEYVINDMTLNGNGQAYVGVCALDFDENQHIGPHNIPSFSYLLLVETDGSVKIASDRMTFPNGMAISPNGKTLVVAETFANRLTSFDINPDGSLYNKRIFADIGAPTDGISMDQEGCVWVAIPSYKFGGTGGWIRVKDGGEILDEVITNTHGAFDCQLGGPEKKHLFLLEASILGLPRDKGDGRVRVVEVDVPGID